MVRIVIKGGVWKNTEDEILKAAVMKYGKNQWARISSLLVRKTPKQCKARWYEWLDPSIKKTEWTREEEEKLLHLAKIMPTQWRTIAPMIGRTAAQCLEHYERLLDAAQERDAELDPTDDPRRLRAGEIDPAPEGKPARPDPVDMDEDEKEMLSEARARLANTKGKKAKRKAREKQLEEAKRLAALQKRRELRAAGIEIRKMMKKKRRSGIDYAEEVPFEKKAPAGFFDITDERKTGRELAEKQRFKTVNLEELEGETRAKVEERERAKDKKRQQIARESNLPGHILAINKLTDPELLRRRSKMILPAPQVSDKELEDIAKLGAVVPAGAAGLGEGRPTESLLASYGSQTPGGVISTPLRTPRTPSGRDALMEDAQNLIRLTKSQTPLLGGENVQLHPSDFSGITPKRTGSQTPSALASGGAGVSGTPMRTPGRSSGGGATPLRDSLGINQDEDFESGGASALTAGLSAKQAIAANKKRQKTAKDKLKAGLSSLPQASNEFALVMPDLPADSADDGKLETEEDAEDIAARVNAQERAQVEAELKRRSMAIQRSLPRPAQVNPKMADDHLSSRNRVDVDASALIRQEMLSMLRYDHARYPVDGSASSKLPAFVRYSPSEISEAQDRIKQELQHSVPNKALDNFKDSFASMWDVVHADAAFIPSTKEYGLLSQVNKENQLQALQQRFELLQQQTAADTAKASKLTQKLSLLLGGYNQRVRKLMDDIHEAQGALSQADMDYYCFKALEANESLAIPQRLNTLQLESLAQENKEKALQTKYSKLLREKDMLQTLLSQAS